MKTKEEKEYIKTICQYPHIHVFLNRNEICSIERLYSIWRKENLLLKLNCYSGKYVFKQINGADKMLEAEKMRELKQVYPEIAPEIIISENNAYLMEFIDGKSFFEIPKEEKIGRILICGAILGRTYRNGSHTMVDISEHVKKSFEKYRKKAAAYFSDSELRLQNFSIFKSVSSQTSHNDLNAANLLFDRGIKLIDASKEEFNDTARDIGRYCASTFFNNYDYFGNNKKHSLDIAAAFLSSFDESTLERAKYFIGESFLSFINFDTKTTPKETLKKLAINMLTKKQPIIKSLEECI
jgi:thiamine kinase-like enzyme